MLKKLKRAEMTSTQITGIILLIAGFVIVLIFYFGVSWQGMSEQEICHQSVVLRASSPSIPTIGEEYIPLRCKTEKICVGAKKLFGKGNCDEFANSKEITYAGVKDEKEIEKLIADEIVECWGTMGEGKVSLFSYNWAVKYGVFGDVYPTCVICSRIAFDEKSLDEKNVYVREINPYEYMMNNKVPGTNKTYYNYLSGSSPAKISVEKFVEIPVKMSDENLEEETTSEPSKVSFEKEPATFGENPEIAVLFMQISAPTTGETFGNIGKAALGITAGAGAGSVYFFGIPATLHAVVKTGTACISNPLTCGAIAVIGGGIVSASAIYTSQKNQGIASGYCGDVSTGSDIRQGCSVIRAVEYNAEDISSYCAVIESIP